MSSSDFAVQFGPDEVRDECSGGRWGGGGWWGGGGGSHLAVGHYSSSRAREPLFP